MVYSGGEANRMQATVTLTAGDVRHVALSPRGRAVLTGSVVTDEGAIVGRIGPGLCVHLGVARGDEDEHAARLAGRIARLRIFENDEGRFDRSVLDTGGAVLVVSQFTLVADLRKGNRPSLSEAAPPERAQAL